ncbi:MAG TPA: FGGY-family carbohydrate kinase [Candidatus Methylomirabilis sp.]|nr:FGGY-family carbohydrate kinase [Candidatus Methylomirabilis sp.]
MTYLIGLDVGTQSVRSCLFDLDGGVVASASRPLRTIFPKPAWAEQDPEEWWRGAVETLKEILQVSKVNPREIAALSYDCTACTVVALTEEGKALRPALLWMDERAHVEAEEVSATAHDLLKYCGGRVSPQWMISKGRWLERHDAAAFERARWIVEETDFFTYRLTGRMTASLDNATAKWNYVRPLGGWPVDFLRAAKAERLATKWPTQVLPVGRSLGRIHEAVAREVGLSPETVVAQGGIDAHAGEIALGAVGAGDLALIMGSSTCHMAQSKNPVFASIWGPYPDALVEGMFTLEGGQTASGSIIQWLVEHFGAEAVRQAKSRSLDVYAYLDGLAESVPPGSEGLLVLDYFQGNRTPYKDPLARGTVIGLTLKHTLPHLYRAVYEGVCFGTRQILEDMATHGFRLEQIYAGGGGAKSRLWTQIQADVLGCPIHLPRDTETMALGAAIWAGLGAGLFQDYRNAIGRMVHIEQALSPDPKRHAAYEGLYRRYVDLYPAVRATMHALAELGAAV